MPSIVKGVLEEELDRSLSLQKKYEQKLADYPKGYLLERKIKGKLYYYLSYREGEKICQKYLGNLPEKEVNNLQKQMEDKKNLKKQLAEVKANIKYLKRLLKQ